MNICRSLRGFCLSNEWAANTFAVLGIGLLLISVWFAVEFQAAVLAWIAHNVVVHGLLFVSAMLLDVLLIAGLLCLGFSECSEADRNCVHAFRGRRYRGQRSRVLPGALSWLDSLGKNPRRS
jgi:hypothetical protein